MTALAVLPIKGFDRAKQRLARQLTAARRRMLVEAMIADVLTALTRTAAVDRIVAVTAEPAAGELARRLGAEVLADDQTGHSDAARRGIQWALEHGAQRALLLPGDCPLLDPGELGALLIRPAPARSALIVPDRHGTGTNALLLSPPDALAPAFGPGSCERHRAAAVSCGTQPQVVPVPSLALDVDTPEDLLALERLLEERPGAAPHTRRVLGRQAAEPVREAHR